MTRRALTLLASLVLLAACNDPKAAAPPDSQRAQVPTVAAQPADLPIIVSIPGSVVSDSRIDLSSRVVGFIKRLDVREGDKVAKGQLLVEVDKSDINETIKQAQASVAAARDDLDDAARDVEKYEKLSDHGFVPAETLRKSKVRREISRSTLARAESALAQASAQLTYADIASPADGVVVARSHNPGEMATTGVPILTIEPRESLVLRVFVPESQVARIDVGMAVGASVDTLAGPLPGTVIRVVPAGDPATRRYQVDVSLAGAPPLMPGMFGRVAFNFGNAPTLAVPTAAIARRGGLDGVFVTTDGVARFRWVRLGRVWTDQTEVVSGLAAGEQIVAKPDASLHEGAIVAEASRD
jgi:RND family efflux transporter MFP subunit